MTNVDQSNPCQQRNGERQSRADFDSSRSQRRLINTSPPRCITPGQPFVPYDTDPPPARGATVDRLVKGMSQQTLETGPTRSSYPSPSHAVGLDANLCCPEPDTPMTYPYALELEIDPDSDNMSPLANITVEPITIYPPSEDHQSLPLPMTIDNDYNHKNQRQLAPVSTPSEVKDEVKGKGKPERRILDMIKTSSQCNIYDAPPPTPTSIANQPATCSSKMLPPPLPSRYKLDIIEVDTALDPCNPLEVDENPDESDFSWMDSIITLRGAANPGGVKKHGLRYRASHEAALRCTNLVHSRPRMRRRKGYSSNSTNKSTTRSIRDNISTTTGPISSAAPSPVAI